MIDVLLFSTTKCGFCALEDRERAGGKGRETLRSDYVAELLLAPKKINRGTSGQQLRADKLFPSSPAIFSRLHSQHSPSCTTESSLLLSGITALSFLNCVVKMKPFHFNSTANTNQVLCTYICLATGNLGIAISFYVCII